MSRKHTSHFQLLQSLPHSITACINKCHIYYMCLWKNNCVCTLRNHRLLPWCKRDIHSSEMLHSVKMGVIYWYFTAYGLSWNVSNLTTNLRWVTSQNSKDYMFVLQIWWEYHSNFSSPWKMYLSYHFSGWWISQIRSDQTHGPEHSPLRSPDISLQVDTHL
jgi:hypothetical protein